MAQFVHAYQNSNNVATRPYCHQLNVVLLCVTGRNCYKLFRKIPNNLHDKEFLFDHTSLEVSRCIPTEKVVLVVYFGQSCTTVSYGTALQHTGCLQLVQRALARVVVNNAPVLHSLLMSSSNSSTGFHLTGAYSSNSPP